MKKFSHILTTAFSLWAAEVCLLVSASDLLDRWRIESPRVTLIESNNTIEMDYGISQELSSDNIRTEIFTESCEYPKLKDGIIEENLNARGAQVFRIDPWVLIENEDVFTADYSNRRAWMKFCLTYSLWSGPESDSIQINHKTTILTIRFDIRGEFGLDEFLLGIKEIDLGDESEITERDGYNATGYLCDPDTFEPMDVPEDGFQPGQFIAICCEISATAKEEGVYLKGVQNFKWTREIMIGGVPTTTVQYSIKNGIVANPLTEYDCPMWAVFCTFKTMLQADFYVLPGNVSGSGWVQMAFKDLGVRRQLGSATAGANDIQPWRTLRQDGNNDENDAVSGIEVTFPIAVSTDRPKVLRSADGVKRFRGSTKVWFVAATVVALTFLAG